MALYKCRRDEIKITSISKKKKCDTFKTKVVVYHLDNVFNEKEIHAHTPKINVSWIFVGKALEMNSR